jgi:hypothetical protein
MKSIKASLVADVDDLLSGNTLAQISIGPEQELLVLSLDQPFPHKVTIGSPALGPLVYKIHRRSSAGWELAKSLAPSGKYYSFVQPLPGGRWLLVGSRAAAGDLNADIFNGSGTIVSSFHAGDGIEHVQATASGEIWIGYFDEGVFGSGELGQSGLVCLNDQGEALLRYRRGIAEPNELPSIDDCYALNVSDDDLVWTSYYSDFPLIKLRNKLLDKVWRDFPAKAVRSFAVNDDQLLMVAAYRKEALLYSVDLARKTLEELRLLDSTGNPLSFECSFGRGSILFFASLKDGGNRALYSFDLRSLRADTV